MNFSDFCFAIKFDAGGMKIHPTRRECFRFIPSARKNES
jgi:hypothetical protein